MNVFNHQNKSPWRCLCATLGLYSQYLSMSISRFVWDAVARLASGWWQFPSANGNQTARFSRHWRWHFEFVSERSRFPQVIWHNTFQVLNVCLFLVRLLRFQIWNRTHLRSGTFRRTPLGCWRSSPLAMNSSSYFRCLFLRLLPFLDVDDNSELDESILLG